MTDPKGSYGNDCARHVCMERPAIYFNPHTRRYYCLPCARRINETLRADGLQLIEGVPGNETSQRIEGK